MPAQRPEAKELHNLRILTIMRLRHDKTIDAREFLTLKTLADCEAGELTYSKYIKSLDISRRETAKTLKNGRNKDHQRKEL